MRVTEKKRVKISTACIDNPIYLRWTNKLGKQDYWLFGFTQTIGFDIGGMVTVERVIENLTTATTKEDVVSKQAVKKMILGASEVKKEDIEGIAGLLYSPKVQLLTNPETWQANGPKWLTVIVDVGSYKVVETRRANSDIEFTIGFPFLNLPAQ